MGCGSSSPINVVDGVGGSKLKLSAEARGVRPPPTGADDEDIPTEVLPDPKKIPVKPPLAFEIPIIDPDEESGTQDLIKKHPPRPPKRLQRLNTIEPSAPSLQELQEKLESAERRRQTILQSRIASANKVTRQLARHVADDTTNEDDELIEELLRSPSKDITRIKNMINAEEHGVHV